MTSSNEVLHPPTCRETTFCTAGSLHRNSLSWLRSPEEEPNSWIQDFKHGGMEGSHVRRVRILSIGEDETLLTTRHLVLESAGFLVRSISSTIVGEPVWERADVALICHTVPRHRAAAIATVLRRINPEISIVQLCRGCDEDVSELQQITSDDPKHLLSEVEKLSHIGKKARDLALPRLPSSHSMKC